MVINLLIILIWLLSRYAEMLGSKLEYKITQMLMQGLKKNKKWSSSLKLFVQSIYTESSEFSFI